MRKLCAILWTTTGRGWRVAPSGEPTTGVFSALCLLSSVLCLLSSCAPAPQAAPRAFLSPVAYVPLVAGPPTDPTARCFDNDPQARAFYRLLVGDPRQERPQLRCEPALVRAAQRRAASLIASGTWSHCDPAGVCSNQVARNMGCRLPADYGDRNNIESLVAGSPNVDVMFNALASSPGHAPHLFGRGWFRHQTQVGIAYVAQPTSRFGFYWVVMIGVCER